MSMIDLRRTTIPGKLMYSILPGTKNPSIKTMTEQRKAFNDGTHEWNVYDLKSVVLRINATQLKTVNGR